MTDSAPMKWLVWAAVAGLVLTAFVTGVEWFWIGALGVGALGAMNGVFGD